MDSTPEREERDFKAMCWTLNALRGDVDLEPFVKVIVVLGYDYSAKLLMENLLNYHHHQTWLPSPKTLGDMPGRTSGLFDCSKMSYHFFKGDVVLNHAFDANTSTYIIPGESQIQRIHTCHVV